MRTRILSAWLVGALPLAVSAQTTGTQVPATGADTKGAPVVGGTATVDFVTLRAGNLGAPLRFGHIVAGSESIQLNGRQLAAGADYAVDYEAGVVYLKTAQRTGDSMVVSYRYDPKGQTAAANFVGVNTFSFTGMGLAPGLGLVGGFGLAERSADGSVMTSNVYGWNNALHFGADGKGSLGGLFLYTERSRNDNQAGLSMDANAKLGDASSEEGKSHFLLQNFQSALMGGTVTASVQDISKGFDSGGQVKSAGYSDADTARLMKERGLKRQMFGLSGMRFGSAALGMNYRTVDDGHGHGLDWRSYNFQQGGLKLSSTSQRVDGNFTRFDDLSEADHAQLAKETGLSRQNLAGEFAQKAGKLSFTSTDVQDDKSDSHVVRREAKLDSGKIGFTFGDQDVDKSFSRVGSLTAAEQGQWGREVGAKRQWEGLTMALGGKTTPQNFAFNQLDLKTDAGRLTARDASYSSKTWTLDHIGIGGKGTAVPGGVLQDAEATAYTKRIGTFFATPNTNDGQRANLLSTLDVKRDLTRLNGNLGKGTTVAADRLQFGEKDNAGLAESVAVNSAKYKLSYRKQDFKDKFADAARLMDFEHARLGAVAGVARSDVAFGMQLDKTRAFNFGQLKAQDATGTADRTTVGYTAKGLTVSGAERKVSSGFANATNLVDPEASLLSTFVGFQERDLTLNYTGGRTYANNVQALKLQMFLQDADNDTTKETRAVQNVDVAWQADKSTNVEYVSQGNLDKTPLATLYDQSLQRLTLTRSFGTLVTFKYMDEQTGNGGTSDTSPDAHKQYYAAEAKIDKLTSVKTEQTRTDYGDGTKEDTSANTLTRTIAKNVGVSVTDVTVNRTGNDNDQRTTNYGFWYDFGKGLRLNYGYAQSLTGDTTGTGNQMLTFGQTPNTLAPNQVGSVGASNIGGIMVGGGYGAVSTLATDPSATHVQSFANVGISTAKPFAFGDVKDLKLTLSLDQAADYSQYIKQNELASLSGRYGKNVFAFGYRSQIANPNAAPTAATVGQPEVAAVDRSVSLTTDTSPKAPIVLNGSVKLRTLPEEQDYTSRNFTITARPAPGLELSNQVQTNLEVANPNVLLGSTLLADRSNKWVLGYKASSNATLAASWEEKSNDATDVTSTLSSLNLTLFGRTGSPLKLSYGVDHIDSGTFDREVTRYSVQYDAKASSTQVFSLFVGNVGYVYSLEDNLKGENWTVRMNYQLRF